MAYIILIGIVLALFVGIGYFVFNQKPVEGLVELSWNKCIVWGIQIYLISLVLGSLTTSIVSDLYNHGTAESLANAVVESFGLLMYAIAFTLFLVLPALIIGLKSISKTKLNASQKQMGFVAINAILVLVINLVMSGFLANWEFMLFLSGFSFFGIVTPWVFVRMKKVFGE